MKSKLEPLLAKKLHRELQAIFDPPTEIPFTCLLKGEQSFIEDRKWAGKRAAEIVEKKYNGYSQVTNEQLSLAFKQAWDERVILLAKTQKE